MILMLELTTCLDPNCGAPGEIVDRWTWPSTDGPIEHVAVHCAAGHHYVHVN